jgi:hypothetical protein
VTSFATKLAQGANAERLVAAWLSRHGWLVVPTCHATKGGAPVATVGGVDLVMPDLLALGREPRWIEVKSKAVASYCRRLNRYEHGADYSHVCDYSAIQNVTGIPVYLFVCEADGPVLYVRLDDTDNGGRHAPDWPGGASSPDRGAQGRGGWLWSRDIMREVRL